jgi:hypothetical protein
MGHKGRDGEEVATLGLEIWHLKGVATIAKYEDTHGASVGNDKRKIPHGSRNS